MSYQTLSVEATDRLAVVTLDRPEARNALNRQVLADLRAALDALREDDRAGVARPNPGQGTTGGPAGQARRPRRHGATSDDEAQATEPGTDPVEDILVVGCGAMGSQIAMLGAFAGYRACAFDLDACALDRAADQLRSRLDRDVAKGRRAASEVDDAIARLSFTTDLDAAAASADFVIEAASEDLEVKRDVSTLARRLGNQPVVLHKEIPCFVANRILGAVRDEAIFLLEDGVASVEDIDTACRTALGYPMGPFELMDLTGIEIGYHAKLARYAVTNDLRDLPSRTVTELVERGELGRKTGQGFYRYDDQGAGRPREHHGTPR